MTGNMPKRLVAAVLLGVVVAGLAGCAADPLAEQYRAGENTGFIAGSGVYEIPVSDRGDPVLFSGVLDTGASVSNADYAGQVLVVNFWYAGCAPCRAEAADLETVHQEFSGENVSFLGINTYDQAETAQAFAQSYGVTYPSVLAADNAELKVAFAERVPLSATPVTLVLDTQGRVAKRIVGPIGDSGILSTLVADVQAEA